MKRRSSEVIERQTVRGAFGSAAVSVQRDRRGSRCRAAPRRLTFERETRTGTYNTTGGQLLGVTRETVPLGPALYLGQASVALVRDSSFFGATAPLYGARSRFELGRTIGTVQYTSVLADWRRYYMPKRPVTIAVRGLHVGRYGRDSGHDQLLDLYAGYPEFVHGYGVGSFSARECLRGRGRRRVRRVPEPARQPHARGESRSARADSRSVQGRA